jgi:hypothetical protein
MSAGAIMKRANPPVRDRPPSSFSRILERLLRAVPGAVGAVLVDAEGETVDYAGWLPPFYTQLLGAHLRLVLDGGTASISASAAYPDQLVVRASRRSFLIKRLPQGFALAIAMARGAFGVSQRALLTAECELAKEAGWNRDGTARTWYPVRVQPALRNRWRPERVRWKSRWEPLDVIGLVVGLHRERGYRCRLHSGPELTLLREPAGNWYADESIEPSDDA